MDTPLIDPKYEPVLRAAVITVLVFGLYAIFKPSSKFTQETLNKRVYKPHRNWWYMSYAFLLMLVSISVGLIASRSNFSINLDSLLIPFVFFGVFFVIFFLSILKLRSSFIKILEDELYTKYGRKENRIPYDQIIDAYYHYGYLHIVLQEKNRHGMHKEKRIPAIFANQGALLENIRQCATVTTVELSKNT